MRCYIVFETLTRFSMSHFNRSLSFVVTYYGVKVQPYHWSVRCYNFLATTGYHSNSITLDLKRLITLSKFSAPTIAFLAF